VRHPPARREPPARGALRKKPEQEQPKSTRPARVSQAKPSRGRDRNRVLVFRRPFPDWKLELLGGRLAKAERFVDQSFSTQVSLALDKAIVDLETDLAGRRGGKA